MIRSLYPLRRKDGCMYSGYIVVPTYAGRASSYYVSNYFPETN